MSIGGSPIGNLFVRCGELSNRGEEIFSCAAGELSNRGGSLERGTREYHCGFSSEGHGEYRWVSNQGIFFVRVGELSNRENSTDLGHSPTFSIRLVMYRKWVTLALGSVTCSDCALRGDIFGDDVPDDGTLR